MDLQNFYTRHNSRHTTRIIVALLFLISSFAYFSWRITVFNQEAWIFSILFFIAEFFGFVITLFTLFITWKVKKRQPPTPPQGLTVDVFIPTYNESEEIVRLTALAVKNITYPHGTWILDDGNRTEIKQLAEELGCRYLTRENNTHAKAGNLNHALKQSNAEFIALFDADHVPESNFLDRLMGYFSDPKVAYVQTPQDFYNLDSFQFSNDSDKKILWHDQSFFYQVGQSGRDYWNAASFCGTCSVVRRSALHEVGGFATETVTEDMHTAVKLQKLGYKSIYHPESLAYGVAATSYVEFLQQRLRWGHGNVQTLREEGLPFCSGLTLTQKICYTGLGMVYFEGIFRFILYLTPALVLLTGIAPIGDTHLFFQYFIPYFLFTWLCIEEYGRGNTRFFTSEFIAMARFPVYILSCLGLFLKRKYWRITSKERSEQISVQYLFPQIFILVVNITGFVVGIVLPPDLLVLSMSGGTIAVICFWALFNVALAGMVIYSIVQSRSSGERYQFYLPVPVTVKSQGYNETCLINTVSADQIIFIGKFNSKPEKGEQINCSFNLNGEIFTPSAEIISCKESSDKSGLEIKCKLTWSGKGERDKCNLNLHHCTWHRVLFWNGGFFKTPVEQISSLFTDKIVRS